MSDRDAMNFSKQLGDFDVFVRRFAIRKLFELKNPVSIPYLITALEDTDTLVRTNAENTLIGIGPVDLDIIIDSLENEDGEVRLRLINVYKQYKTLSKLERLVKFLQDPDQDVANITISVFNKDLNVEASAELWELLKNPQLHKEYRELYFNLLYKNCKDISETILEDIKSNKLDNFSMEKGSILYFNLNSKGNEYFLDKLNSKIANERILSLYSNAALNIDNIIKIATDATDDIEENVRKVAVKLIGKYGTEKELKQLYILQNTPDKGVWKVCKEAIIEIEKKN